jgi:arylsulfatase
MHAPAHLNPGVTDSLISSIDIAATVLELAGVQKDERIQGVSFVPLLKNHTATVRDVVFAEHNWHVYSNHERMVRAGDWLYIRNNMPDKQNLCGEAYIGGAGNDLWRLHQSGELNQAQSNIFWNPCPPEELYHVRKDPHQLNNVAVIPENQRILQNMRALLGEWGKRTGDSIPGNPTPDRDAPPGAPPKDKKNFRHGEMPGESNNATQINDPGVILLKGIKL